MIDRNDNIDNDREVTETAIRNRRGERKMLEIYKGTVERVCVYLHFIASHQTLQMTLLIEAKKSND